MNLSDSDIYRNLQEIINRVFRREDIVAGPDLMARDVAGWDSFKHISIIMAIEESFGIRFLDSELDQFECLRDIANVVSRKIGLGE